MVILLNLENLYESLYDVLNQVRDSIHNNKCIVIVCIIIVLYRNWWT